MFFFFLLPFSFTLFTFLGAEHPLPLRASSPLVPAANKNPQSPFCDHFHPVFPVALVPRVWEGSGTDPTAPQRELNFLAPVRNVGEPLWRTGVASRRAARLRDPSGCRAHPRTIWGQNTRFEACCMALRQGHAAAAALPLPPLFPRVSVPAARAAQRTQPPDVYFHSSASYFLLSPQTFSPGDFSACETLPGREQPRCYVK